MGNLKIQYVGSSVIGGYMVFYLLVEKMANIF